MTEEWKGLGPRLGAAGRRVLWLMVAALGLWVLFLPEVGLQLRDALALRIFEGDVRQHVAPLWRYHDPALLAGDYVAGYYLALMPAGYEWLAGTLARWLTPPEIGLWLQFATFAALLPAAGATVYRLAGAAAAMATLALLLSAHIFFSNIAGGCPRAFGYPLIALLAWGLVAGRPLLLGLTAVLGALFYAPVAIVSSLTLALVELTPGPVARLAGVTGRAPLKRRGLTLALFGLVTLAILIGSLMDQRPYGGSVSANDPAQVAEFPERLGRHPINIQREAAPERMGSALWWFTRSAVYDYSAPKFVPFVWRNLQWRDLPLVALLAVAAVGYGLGARASSAMRRLLVLPLAMLVAAALAILLYPRLYYPTRYFEYVLPLFLVMAAPVGMAMLAARLPFLRQRRHWQSAAVLAATAVLVLGWGSRGSLERGTSLVRVDDRQAALYAFVAGLPKDAMVAGWPTGAVENVTFLTGRPALLSHEIHAAFHTDYILTMRRRMTDLIDAYFGTDMAALERLKSIHGVTHLIVDPGDFQGDRPPAYFAPFDEHAARVYARLKGPTDVLVMRLRDQAVYDRDGFFVLDLNQLPTGAATAPEAGAPPPDAPARP